MWTTHTGGGGRGERDDAAGVRGGPGGVDGGRDLVARGARGLGHLGALRRDEGGRGRHRRLPHHPGRAGRRGVLRCDGGERGRDAGHGHGGVDLGPLQARFLLALLLPLLDPLLERDPVPRRHLARELHAKFRNF